MAQAVATRPYVGRTPVNWRKVRHWTGLIVALLFFLVIAFYPVAVLIHGAFVNDYDLIDPSVNPFWFKRPLGFNHFQYLFQQTNFLTWVGNTAIVCGCVLLVTLAVCLPGGYALARLRFAGAQNIGIGIFMTYLVPPILLFIPLTVAIASLGLLNSKWALVVVYPSFTIPFCLWLMMGFFKRIPVEIEEAALVDGCNRWQTFYRIILPLTGPGLVAASIYGFIQTWNEFIIINTLNNPQTHNLMAWLVSNQTLRGTAWGPLMAGATMAALPVVVLFLVIQRNVATGLTAGAVKG
jgi:ABC-type glycerol-3-phosphate transport system permease component